MSAQTGGLSPLLKGPVASLPVDVLTPEILSLQHPLAPDPRPLCTTDKAPGQRERPEGGEQDPGQDPGQISEAISQKLRDFFKSSLQRVQTHLGGLAPREGGKNSGVGEGSTQRMPEQQKPKGQHKPKRRKGAELAEHEKWHCPFQCGKFYRKTSTRSIRRHRNECKYRAVQNRDALDSALGGRVVAGKAAGVTPSTRVQLEKHKQTTTHGRTSALPSARKSSRRGKGASSDDKFDTQVPTAGGGAPQAPSSPCPSGSVSKSNESSSRSKKQSIAGAVQSDGVVVADRYDGGPKKGLKTPAKAETTTRKNGFASPSPKFPIHNALRKFLIRSLAAVDEVGKSLSAELPRAPAVPPKEPSREQTRWPPRMAVTPNVSWSRSRKSVASGMSRRAVTPPNLNLGRPNFHMSLSTSRAGLLSHPVASRPAGLAKGSPVARFKHLLPQKLLLKILEKENKWMAADARLKRRHGSLSPLPLLPPAQVSTTKSTTQRLSLSAEISGGQSPCRSAARLRSRSSSPRCATPRKRSRQGTPPRSLAAASGV